MPAVGPSGPLHRVWAGFARSEILPWWLQRGGELVDVPAEEFAERSDATGNLVWDAVPAGLVIRGLLDRQSSHELLKIVTRRATPAELEKFQHERMPLLEKPLHPVPGHAMPPPGPPASPPENPPALVQEMLFEF